MSMTPIPPTFTSVTPGIVPKSGGGTTNFLRADATWTPVSSSGYWAPVTNGSASAPEIIFDSDGDIVVAFVVT